MRIEYHPAIEQELRDIIHYYNQCLSAYPAAARCHYYHGFCLQNLLTSLLPHYAQTQA
ncbi:MAG: hypothetical protein HOP34_02640 [Methylococcaceae bacterium]|nr:hypothetical protein [Methylococcaceae bacterium]